MHICGQHDSIGCKCREIRHVTVYSLYKHRHASNNRRRGSNEITSYFFTVIFNDICHTDTYYSSHIVQIMDFLEFLHEYCKEKSETSTKFKSSLVLTKNIKIRFWPASPVKNRHKMHYHREFTYKREVTLADARRKIGCS